MTATAAKPRPVAKAHPTRDASRAVRDQRRDVGEPLRIARTDRRERESHASFGMVGFDLECPAIESDGIRVRAAATQLVGDRQQRWDVARLH